MGSLVNTDVHRLTLGRAHGHAVLQPGAVQRDVFETGDHDEITEFLRATCIGNKTTFGPARGETRWRAATTATPAIAADAIRSTID